MDTVVTQIALVHELGGRIDAGNVVGTGLAHAFGIEPLAFFGEHDGPGLGVLDNGVLDFGIPTILRGASRQCRHWSGKNSHWNLPSMVSLNRSTLRVCQDRSGGFWCEPVFSVGSTGLFFHCLQAIWQPRQPVQRVEINEEALSIRDSGPPRPYAR